jgi:hypothetical protein
MRRMRIRPKTGWGTAQQHERNKDMTATDFRPKAYLKEGCPYSFKYLLFMAEAGLVDRIDIVRCDPESPDFEATKRRLAQATGRDATFPTVEIEPRRYLTDSDRLIDHFAGVYKVDPGVLPALSFYKETVFPQLTALHE